jgi:phosphoenolpyruvate-protein kinase (PTS system EI component)
LRVGGNPKVEIMIPLVGSVMELHLIRDEMDVLLAKIASDENITLPFSIGTMIELPRAALTAQRIAEAAEFFSFGTNDLTQTTWGFSRRKSKWQSFLLLDWPWRNVGTRAGSVSYEHSAKEWFHSNDSASTC